MPDIVSAICTDPADRVISTDYGDRVVADFDVNGNEVSIWEDADSREAAALKNLSEGQNLQLIQNEGKNGPYYTLRDSDIEALLNEGQSQSEAYGHDRQSTTLPQDPPQQQAPPRGQEQSKGKNLQSKAQEHARLIANTYAFLDDKFASQAGNINTMPSDIALQKMAVSAAIEAVKNQ